MRVRLQLETLESRDIASGLTGPSYVIALEIGNIGGGSPPPLIAHAAAYAGEAAGEAGQAEGQVNLPWAYVNRLDCHLIRQYRNFRPKVKNLPFTLDDASLPSYTEDTSTPGIHDTQKGETHDDRDNDDASPDPDRIRVPLQGVRPEQPPQDHHQHGAGPLEAPPGV